MPQRGAAEVFVNAVLCTVLILFSGCKQPQNFAGAPKKLKPAAPSPTESPTTTPTFSPSGCGNIPEGAVISSIGYESETVPPGSACQEKTRTKTCRNGVLDPEWNPKDLFDTCTPERFRDCVFGNLTISHGTSITKEDRYQTAQVPAGGTCRKVLQTGTCANGILSWVPPDHTLAAICTVQGYANCFENGVFAASHGTAQTQQNQTTVAASDGRGSCLQTHSQNRTCWNGTLSPWGTSQFVNQTCTCRDEQNRIYYPQSANARSGYAEPEVAPGETCRTVTQSRTCQNDGTWSAWTPPGTLHPHCQVQAEPVQVCTPTSQLPTSGFADTATNQHRDNINSAASAGIIGAVTGRNFYPSQGLQRGESTLVVMNMLRCLREIQIPSAVSQNQIIYSDVNFADPWAEEIVAATSYKIVVGYDNGTFRPSQVVTRAEFITMLYQAVKTGRSENGLPAESLSFRTTMPFSDVNGHWAADNIRKMAGYCNLASLSPGQFFPNSQVTRDFAAASAVVARNCLKGELAR